jgi:hypothetical protein
MAICGAALLCTSWGKTLHLDWAYGKSASRSTLPQVKSSFTFTLYCFLRCYTNEAGRSWYPSTCLSRSTESRYLGQYQRFQKTQRLHDSLIFIAAFGCRYSDKFEGWALVLGSDLEVHGGA